MAKVITPTPTLEGKDRENFYAAIDKNIKHDANKQKFLDDCKNLVKKIKFEN